MHTSNRDTLRPRGVRLLESVWKELEAIQLRRGHGSIQTTVREAAEEYIARHSRRHAA